MASMIVAPLAVPADAISVADVKTPQNIQKLNTKSETSVDVMTELDCSSHTLTAIVKNKTTATIHPVVTFNDEQPRISDPLPIKSGETGRYTYSFSGNNIMVDVVVKGDTFGVVETSPTLNCLEPVSFKVTDWSDSAVVGELRNNSTIVPQTVYTQVNNGDVRLETLEPGETRLVAMPF